MKLPGILFLFLLLTGRLGLHAQSTTDWKAAESFLQYYKSPVRNAAELKQLGKENRMQFSDTLTRLKVAYLWVTKNIQYDCEGLKNKNSRWAIDSVLKNRKAVCAGFVNVFRNLCEASGVVCIDISGFGRSGFHDLVLSIDSFAMNHTWNAVRINGAWKLIDITWASGFTDEDCTYFTAFRNDWYFDTAPSRFLWDHYPADPGWQLMQQPLDWERFVRLPLVYHGVTESRMENFYPQQVILKKKIGDTIEFRFTCSSNLNAIIFRSRNNPRLYHKGFPERTGNTYKYIYTVDWPGTYDLQVDLLLLNPPKGIGTYEIFSFTDLVYQVETLDRKFK